MDIKLVKIIKYIRLVIKILTVLPILMEGIELSVKKVQKEIKDEGLL